MEELVVVHYIVRPKEVPHLFDGIPKKNNLHWGAIYTRMRTARITPDGFCEKRLRASMQAWGARDALRTFQVLSVERVLCGEGTTFSFEQFLEIAQADSDHSLRTHHDSAPH